MQGTFALHVACNFEFCFKTYCFYLFSIAIEPLYPQMCQKQQPYVSIEQDKGYSSPIEWSRFLNSIACSLSLKREDPICLFDYISEARNFTQSLWNLGNDLKNIQKRKLRILFKYNFGCVVV